MHSRETRIAARRQIADGASIRSTARSLGIARSTLRAWRDTSVTPSAAFARCWICAPQPIDAARASAYVYLLGQYLGDGYLVTDRLPGIKVSRLRVACADGYPAIAELVDRSMQLVSGNRTGFISRTGCSDRYCDWTHWACVLPHDGPGRKHERLIALAAWQWWLVESNPWDLLRGLVHSDGCRTLNTVGSAQRRYVYPRYFISNKSLDVLRIAGLVLDQVGVAWRYNRADCISVARRAAVVEMDRHIGPKS